MFSLFLNTEFKALKEMQFNPAKSVYTVQEHCVFILNRQGITWLVLRLPERLELHGSLVKNSTAI